MEADAVAMVGYWDWGRFVNPNSGECDEEDGDWGRREIRQLSGLSTVTAILVTRLVEGSGR